MIIIGVALVGCAGNKTKHEPRPPIHITSEQYTLNDLCKIVERHVYNAGIAKASNTRRSQYEEDLDMSDVPSQMATDVIMNIETTWRLPLENEEAAAAYANFVYEKCIQNNQ